MNRLGLVPALVALLIAGCAPKQGEAPASAEPDPEPAPSFQSQEAREPAASEESEAASDRAGPPGAAGAPRIEQQLPSSMDEEGLGETEALEALQRAEAELGNTLALSTPDCDQARELVARICDLAERICTLADEAGAEENEARCIDGRERCQRANKSVAARCD